MNPDLSLDETFLIRKINSTSFYGVQSICRQLDGKILIGGNIDRYNDLTIPNNSLANVVLLRLNPDGTIDNTFQFYNTGITTLKVDIQGDKILILNTNKDLIRLNTDGAIDYTFGGFHLGEIDVEKFWQLADGRIIAHYRNISNGSYYLRAFNPNGQIIPTFQSLPFDGNVNDVCMQQDGKIFVGGNFYSINNIYSYKLMRLNIDGTYDSSFSILNGNNGFQPIPSVFTHQVYSLAIQTDGKVLVCGDFATYNNIETNGLARFHSDGSFDSTYNIGVGFDLSYAYGYVRNIYSLGNEILINIKKYNQLTINTNYYKPVG